VSSDSASSDRTVRDMRDYKEIEVAKFRGLTSIVQYAHAAEIFPGITRRMVPLIIHANVAKGRLHQPQLTRDINREQLKTCFTTAS